MRPSYLMLLLLAACSEAPQVEGRLLARRAALGLERGSLLFAEAMRRVEAGAYEPLLARVGSRRLSDEEVLDAALALENLLVRADVTTAGEARDADPARFDAGMAASREGALALARAVAAGERGEEEARALLVTCIDCHVMYRKPQ